MADDLDAFLRRAAQQRKKRKPGIVVLDDATSPPAKPPVLPAERPPAAALGPRRPGGAVPAPSAPSQTQSASPDLQHESVEEHVQRHLDDKEFEQRIANLGVEIEQADDRLEARLHQIFDHEVGTLSHKSADTGDAQEMFSASAFQSLFQSMDELRRAIILREILERPFS